MWDSGGEEEEEEEEERRRRRRGGGGWLLQRVVKIASCVNGLHPVRATLPSGRKQPSVFIIIIPFLVTVLPLLNQIKSENIYTTFHCRFFT